MTFLIVVWKPLFVQSQFSVNELVFRRNSDMVRNVGDLAGLNSDNSFPK